MASSGRTVERGIVILAAGIIALVVGYLLFLLIPGRSLARLLGVVLLVATVAAAVKLASNGAASLLPEYDVAEVEIDDVITRDGDAGPVPVGGSAVSADDVVEQIERADEDDAAEALVVTLNTPGGQVVPSEDIRRAAAEFDGPTVAYAEDVAASGGYWIASGCDRLHARRGSIVGSIGVNGTHLGRAELAEKVGLNYRRFVAGEYKDTISSQWRELEDDETEYIQGLLDGYYEQFVDTVVDGRGMEEAFVRDTEARIYLGEEAHEAGLVDSCGPREEMEAWLADELGVDEVAVEEFEPEQGLTDRLNLGAQRVAHAFGAGVASAVVGEDASPPVRLR